MAEIVNKPSNRIIRDIIDEAKGQGDYHPSGEERIALRYAMSAPEAGGLLSQDEVDILLSSADEALLTGSPKEAEN